jgi:hypothetical protein
MLHEEKLKDTRSRKWKDGQCSGQMKKNKQRSTKHYTKRLPFPASHVTPDVLMLNDTNTIWYGNRVGHQYK